jgi:hypothetical protein
MPNHLVRPRPAGAVFLGDGVSLDRIDGRWEDRYGEPVMAALEAAGVGTFVMQAGDMRRTPWRRPTFAANIIEAAGHALAPFLRAPVVLPGEVALARFLRARDISAPSLSPGRLARRAATLRATARVFERILRKVRPRLAFVVTWYAGLAPAFLLACRRQGILSVDLQHCPQGGRHKAYRWGAVPERGYGMLPAVFWNWGEADSAVIDSWSTGPWHRSLHGGHPRLGPFLADADPRTRQWDDLFRRMRGDLHCEREILVALQTIGRQGNILDALAERIASSPPNWRWWIRRHPAARRRDDALYARLLELRGPNIRIEEASALPLPALLRHMSVTVSIASGVAAEAAFFGVPAIFLSDDARGLFGYLVESGHARILEDLAALPGAITALAPTSSRAQTPRPPELRPVLSRLNEMADEYARLRRREG